MDDYLEHLLSTSPLSQSTQRTYARWVEHACRFAHVTHLLEVSPQQLNAFRVHLLTDCHFSPSSDIIVWSAFKHIYGTLLRTHDPQAAKKYAHLFTKAPRQPHTLPRYADQETMQRFLAALPRTAVGFLIKEVYRTGKPLNTVGKGWKYSPDYVKNVCAETARRVNIPHGFGITGVRGTGIIHRIQGRHNDTELIRIYEDSELSSAQFVRYLQAAGCPFTNIQSLKGEKKL